MSITSQHFCRTTSSLKETGTNGCVVCKVNLSSNMDNELYISVRVQFDLFVSLIEILFWLFFFKIDGLLKQQIRSLFQTVLKSPSQLVSSHSANVSRSQRQN